mgnify:CR=1 FL=1
MLSTVQLAAEVFVDINHRIMESFELEGTYIGHLIQLSGQPVPMPHHPYCKNFFLYPIEISPPLV